MTPRGGNASSLIGDAITVVSAVVSPRERLTAIERTETLLLRRLGFGTEGSGLDDICANNGVDKRWLRAAALKLLRAVARQLTGMAAVSRQEAVAIGRAALATLDPPPEGQWSRTPRQLLPARIDPLAPELRMPGGSRPPTGLSVNTVHGVKGQGADAVLFIVSDRDDRANELLAAWRARATEGNEALRVAYVAMTRAKRLLGLALPSGLAEELAALLSERAVALEMAPPARPAEGPKRVFGRASKASPRVPMPGK